jgi:hypothetical protein
VTVDEFNKARLLTAADLLIVMGNPTPENVSQLMIKLALHGLVVVPFDHYPDSIPEPLCTMVYVPTTDQPEHRAVNSYLVPADQIK